MVSEPLPRHRGTAMTARVRRLPRPFDLLASDVRGISEQLRNHVNPELRKLHAGQRRMDRKLVDVQRRFNTIDGRLDDLDGRFDNVEARLDEVGDSVSELLDLLYSVMYGGDPTEEGQPTLWPDEGETNGDTEEA